MGDDQGETPKHAAAVRDDQTPKSLAPLPLPSTESSNIAETDARPPRREELLFHKILYQSDVGRFNRLVIPRHLAEAHFPSLKNGSNGYNKEMLQLADRQNRTWEVKFEYCPRSQSYSFTKGWKNFVKGHKLQKDCKLCFYKIFPQMNANHYVVDYENPAPDQTSRLSDQDNTRKMRYVRSGPNVARSRRPHGDKHEEPPRKILRLLGKDIICSHQNAANGDNAEDGGRT
ncbi:PREDICTED: B3 domain-containing protein At2g36080-like [Nelumbo nucifera]|uniref:TF-B3 domain-containing protein n=2 Tax=Nelumbo nucifera TaxID=4432 RepID=A0A822XK11_NELNU|nr:PREDICTED: B3 domain-containing protein At2g36080-like [Nelumbo nucifera]DAD19471.1 TPA_asm: hypothetical protein HUJ06_020934 [Nelumbo nucifera]